MPRDMHPPPPLPKNLMKVHTAVVWIAAAAIRSMSYHRDQYQSFLQSTPHDSDWERREYSRRTNILDEERRGLAATPYEDVRMYVTSMSSIVRQYSHSSLPHTRVRALHSAAATKVILRTVIPRLGSARDRVLQDVKALLEETSSDPFIALVLLVLPGRNALTLLTQPGPTSDLWSGQSMSVEDYKAAVSELESWTFPERWVGFTSTAAPIERERRPYKADFSSSNGIERQRRPYQGSGTGEFTDFEATPNTRSSASAPRMSPSLSSESQHPPVVQPKYGSQFTQTSHLPRTRTRGPSAPAPAAENPLPRPPQLQPESPPTLFEQLFGQTSLGSPPATYRDGDDGSTTFERVFGGRASDNSNSPLPTQPAPPAINRHLEQTASRRPPPLSTRRDRPELISILSPQIAEQMRQREDDPYTGSEDMPEETLLPRPPQANVVEPQTSRAPPPPAALPHRFAEQLSAQRARTPDDPASAPPYLRNAAPPTLPSASRPPSGHTSNSQSLPASLDNPPPYSPPSSRPQPTRHLGAENVDLYHDESSTPSPQSLTSLITMFEDNPLSLIHSRDPYNPISFVSTSGNNMRWIIDALDIEIISPMYLPTGSATVIIDYPTAAMGALLQASDIVDGDIMMSCYRFSSDPMAWFRESQGAEFVHPEWGREWERYWVWGILYREGDVKVRVKRRMDVDEVRAWLGGSRIWTEG